MASIKDIAKLCGVSVATVSKALNDKADISEDTKQHIKHLIYEGLCDNIKSEHTKNQKRRR